MAIADVFFTPSILITLAICLILISALGLFFIQKLNQQNHKINTMFDLVNTLAQEVSVLKQEGGARQEDMSMGDQYSRTHNAREQMTNNTQGMYQETSENMINVSSDESDDDSDDDDSDDDDSDDESNESDSDNEGEEDNDITSRKIIELESSGIAPNADDFREDSDDESDEESDESDDTDPGSQENTQDTAQTSGNIIDLSQTIDVLPDLHEETFHEEDIDIQEKIHVSSDDKGVKNLDIVLDYKKASLPKLREIVQTKGIVDDAAKMKRADLLKLLDSD